MRIRFLKSGKYEGLYAAVVDGAITVSNRRISVDALINYEIQNYALVENSNVDITLKDGTIIRVPSDDIEITTPPEGPMPAGACCNK